MKRTSINQYFAIPMVLSLALLNTILILYFYNEWQLISQNTPEASFYNLDSEMKKAYIASARNAMGLLFAVIGIELTALFFRKGIVAMTLLILINILGYFFILS
jgi:fatty acid desaturase